MKSRSLGNSGILVPQLVFGGNVFGWTANQTTSFRLLDACIEAGLNVIDTADVYTRMPPFEGGESETVIGNWLAQRGGRDRVVIATKVGWDMGAAGKGLSKAYIRQAVEASLRRLQTDYIDLYQAHIDDAHTPIEETLEAFDGLVREGKVRTIGASNYSPARLREALAVSDRSGLARFQSIQPRYNLYDRAEYEGKLEELAREEGLAVLTYFSLASGFLSAKYRTASEAQGSRRAVWLQDYFTPRGLRILDALREVSSQKQASPAQVALAWVMARPGVTAAIASATGLEQLDDLLAAVQLELDRDSLDALYTAAAYRAGEAEPG